MSIDVASIIVALTALVVGIPAVIAAVRGSQAAKRLDTGNGKDIGETVHEMSQTIEHIAAQQHTNAQEIIDLNQKMDEHIEVSERTQAENQIVHERLLKEHGLENRRERDT